MSVHLSLVTYYLDISKAYHAPVLCPISITNSCVIDMLLDMSESFEPRDLCNVKTPTYELWHYVEHHKEPTCA